MYIIIWKNNYPDPHVSQDSHGFKESFESYEEAEQAAKETVEQEGNRSEWYYDFQIYEEANN